ncbi:MAG: hypothetical protein ACO28X_04460 [Ilumatobacteraceae bacterium]
MSVGEWETGLDIAHDRGIIDADMHRQLKEMSFDRAVHRQGFPMRIAFYVLGAVLLIAAGFAAFLRVLGPDPSQLLAASLLALIGAIIEGIAWLVRRAKSLSFLAGIVGAFAGIPLGFALAIALPGDPNAGSGSLAALLAALWSVLWFSRTRSGVAIAAVVGELAFFVGFVGDWSNLSSETVGVILCVVGVGAALLAIFGRIKPSLPPLVVSLIVTGVGCGLQNSYGGDVIAVIGIALSAALFVVAYRRGEALASAATAVSTGVWAVVLSFALTEGALAPLIVSAVIGVGLIAWGIRLSRQ